MNNYEDSFDAYNYVIHRNVIKKLLKIYPTKDMLTDELKIEFKKPEAIVIEDHSSHHDHHPFGNYFGHGSDS